MARYKVTTPSYINEGLRAVGDVVDLPDDFPPGHNLEPYADEKGKVDPAAKKAKDAMGKEKRLSPGDPDYVGAMIAHTMQDGSTTGRVGVQSANLPSGPAGGAVNVVTDGAGHATGVTTGVAQPVQAPYASPQGVPPQEAQKAVQEDIDAKAGKGPVAQEAAKALDRKG